MTMKIPSAIAPARFINRRVEVLHFPHRQGRNISQATSAKTAVTSVPARPNQMPANK